MNSTKWTPEALALSRRLAISLGQFEQAITATGPRSIAIERAGEMIVKPSTGGKAPVIEDGLYEVLCTGVEPIQLDEPDQYGNTDKLEFHLQFKEAGDDGEPITLDPRVNIKWGEKATLYGYAVGFGLAVSPHEEFDTDLFEGRMAKVLVETEEGHWPRVVKVMPIKGSVQKVTVAEPDFDGFWKRVRAAGFDNSNVAPLVDGDLGTLVKKSQKELDAILEALGI